MYFKVMKDNDIVDVLDHIVYIKYQKKHDLFLICNIKDSQAVLSSDGKYGWHIEGLYNFPPDNTTYKIEEISKFEYDNLKKR